ncbi:hypothetical protein ACRAWF_19545 [Streptomyces sp. L7]
MIHAHAQAARGPRRQRQRDRAAGTAGWSPRLVTADTSADEIAAAMTGRAVELDRVHAPGTPGDGRSST